jgi:outer membrane receptor protein involved in Fe transport
MDAGATVLLLDGQRVAPSGSDAGWEDATVIPLGAIERIDLLPESATAEYGTDALAGVVNLRLRSNFLGNETTLRTGMADGPVKERDINQLFGTRWDGGHGVLALEYYSRDALAASERSQATSDQRALGGSNFDVVGGNPGTIVSGANTWAIPNGQDGRSLSAASLVAGTQTLTDRWQGASVLPQEARTSLFGSLTQSVGDVALTADALLADRKIVTQTAGYETALSIPTSNPFYVNPTGVPGPVLVLYGFGPDLGPLTTHADERIGNVRLGAKWQPAASWQAETTLGYSFERDTQTIRGFVDPAALAAALADPDLNTAFDPFWRWYPHESGDTPRNRN